MKVVSIVGARPQFIKAAPVGKALRGAGHHEILVYTGQHYDYGMSEIFFKELNMPEPDMNLGVGSGSHGWQTGQMLIRIEEVLQKEKPDWVIVYGDTNSTLAGALAAVKLHIPLAHVEAGLRSFNRGMPEEHNRVLTDHCADLLFCPTRTAVRNLQTESFNNILNNGNLVDYHLFENAPSSFSAPENPKAVPPGSLELSPLVVNVGDTMYDAVVQFSDIARKRSKILQDLGLEPKGYLLATVHRPYNTDNPEHLSNILNAFLEIGEPVIFPVHPRTRKRMADLDMLNPKSKIENLKLIDPVGYLDMLVLEQNARVVLTDSGGMQKEACFFEVPCVTLRPETEWVETVEAGWNQLAGSNKDTIVKALEKASPGVKMPGYGNGDAALKVVEILKAVRLIGKKHLYKIVN